MKKLICTVLALCLLACALVSCGSAPAFEGTVEEILDNIVTKAIELDTEPEFGIASIECTPTVVDAENCESVLGLSEEEFNEYVEAAIESKPNGSWYTHSIVVIKLKDGVDVPTVAEKIVMNTKPNRFGCLKPRSIVGARAGQYVIFSASSETSTEAVYNAVKALSAVEPTRIDRENDWSSSGGLMGGGLLG